MTIKAGVIGYPIKHSFSPIIHNYWLDKYKIDGSYEAIEVKPEELEEFILNLRENGFAGVNVTLPHKERVFELPFITIRDSSTVQIKAVNTVIVQDIETLGLNTDWVGFDKNIFSNGIEFKNINSTSVILGAGGASLAIIHDLLTRFKNIIIINRTREKAEIIKESYKIDSFYDRIKILDWDERHKALEYADMLVNTTSCGMVGRPELKIDLSLLPKTALVTDIVYNPLITTLLQQAKDRGNPIVDGLGMLLHQAAPGFKAWFDPEDKIIDGLPEVTEELRELLKSSLPEFT